MAISEINFGWNKYRTKVVKFSVSGTSLPYEIDITNMQLEFGIKADYDDAENIISRSSLDGTQLDKIVTNIGDTAGQSGQFYVYLSSGDGVNLTHGRQYYYDIKYMQSGAFNIAESGQLVQGFITVNPSVVR